MRPINAQPLEGKVKLHSAIRGDGAYDEFKQIASEFYGDHTYKFVGLTLDGEPREDIVTFTAEFWCVPDGAEATTPNDPLTLEELREMDGEPVWVVEGTLSYHALMSGVLDTVVWLVTRWDEREMQAKDYGKTWFAYRRKLEED